MFIQQKAFWNVINTANTYPTNIIILYVYNISSVDMSHIEYMINIYSLS